MKIIEKYMQERDDVIQQFKDIQKLVEKKATLDPKAREYLNSILAEYTTSNPTSKAQILAEKFQAGDHETIADYYTNPDIEKLIDSVSKTNIKSLSNEEIQNLVDNLRYQLDQ